MTKLYCIPGTMCDERLWQDMSAHLYGAIELVHVPIPDGETLEQMVTGILEQLPSDPVNLLGFSLGGYLLSEIARFAPQRIKRAIVLSNSAGALPEAEKHQREEALAWVLKAGYRGVPTKKAKAMLLAGHGEDERLVSIIKAMDQALGERAFVTQLKATLNRRDNIEMIASSQANWLFLLGLEDQFISERAFRKLATLDNVTLRTVAQSGHMLPLEQPKWVAKKVLAFLKT